jgi:putative peptidoglycan lipid II flippase
LRPILTRTLSARQLQIASLLIGTSFIFSGVLGVVRGSIINSTFGAGAELDAFLAAFRVPELLFTLVAGGALGAAFIPVYSRYLTDENTIGGWELANTVLTIVGICAAILAIVCALFAPQIVASVISPEAPPDQQALIANLMRIMLVTVFIFAMSGLMMGILNANQRFLAPALTPSLYNIGLIIGAIFFAPSMGVYGLAWGAVLGAMLHLGVQIPSLREVGFKFQPSLQWRISGAREVFWLMAPRIVGQGVTQINFLVNTTLALGLSGGDLTALMTAFGLMFTVLGVLGQSIGTAVFPTLSLYYAQSDMDGFRRTLSSSMRSVLFTTIPAALGLVAIAIPLIATIYGRGKWTEEATTATAWALGFFALGLPAFGLQEVLARSFYAIKDTMTPVAIAVGGVVLNIVLSLLLIRVVQGSDPAQGPFGGLAISNVVATYIESAALWLLLRRKVGSLYDTEILTTSARVLIAAVIMGIVVIGLDRSLLASAPMLIRLAVGGIVGAGVFEGVALLIGVPEARSVPQTLLRRFKR